MSLAQLIDPGLLFARPLGLTSAEHSGRLLGISNNYVKRQAEIFRHAKDNSIVLEAYIKQITTSQNKFDEQRQQLHQSTTQFTLPQGTHSYIYWANLVCPFLFTPIILILVIVVFEISNQDLKELSCVKLFYVTSYHLHLHSSSGVG